MPKPSEMGHLYFDPPITLKSDRYHRAWELLDEMDLRQEVVMSYRGNTELYALGFPSKEQAMLFKLRL